MAVPDRSVRNHENHSDVNEQTALLGATEREEQESWNEPKVNGYRFLSVNLTFFILGLNDACVGVSRSTSGLLQACCLDSMRN